MRAAILLIALSAAQAGVVSRDWANGKLSLRLDDGPAEIEWISGTTFRFSKGGAGPQVAHEAVNSEFEDTKSTLKLRGKYLTIEVDKPTALIRVSANGSTISAIFVEGNTLHLGSLGRTFGLANSNQFFFTSGYGMYVRSPAQSTFLLEQGLVNLSGPAVELFFYYGPTAKEVFEQHQNVVGRTEILSTSSALLPAGATPLNTAPLESWEILSKLVRTLNDWSLSAILYPALDLSMLSARGEIGKRAEDLAAMVPLVYGNTSEIRAARDPWIPYLITYLREAFDRGYPLIRPLPVQFSRDKLLNPQPDVFMLGDEVLLAPMVVSGGHRVLQLPRSNWTDLRTNKEYKGNQEIEVEAPTGFVPMFARQGALFPLAAKGVTELHYFPSLGGEFFLWEPTKQNNSQFHAAPAGEFMRVEIESLIPRTYEWVIHHTNRPATVEEAALSYKPVKAHGALKTGTWWHDAGRNDLHVMVQVLDSTDRIVNISF